MKFNSQWLEKYSLVTVQREVKNKKTNTLTTDICTNFKTSSNSLCRPIKDHKNYLE